MQQQLGVRVRALLVLLVSMLLVLVPLLVLLVQVSAGTLLAGGRWSAASAAGAGEGL
jgi:hypothetical protein